MESILLEQFFQFEVEFYAFLYFHELIIPKKTTLTFKDRDTGAHTNSIEGPWKWAKRSLPASGRYKSIYIALHLWVKNHPRTTRFISYMKVIFENYTPN